MVTGSIRTVQVWEIHGGRELPLRIKEPIGGFNAVAVSPDGQRVMTGEGFGAVRLWELATGHELRTLTGHELGAHSVAFSPDGDQIVTVGVGGTVRVWDMAGGRGALTLKGHEDPVTSIAVTPDGKWLVTGSEDGTATIWDVAGGRRPRTIHGGVRTPPDYSDYYVAGTEVAVTPDGQRLVTGSSDGTVKVWDLHSGRPLLTLQEQGHRVTCVAVTADGRWVVIGSDDGTVRVWDTASHGEPLLLEGHIGPINSVAVYSDGRRLVTGGGDGTARLWELPGGRPLLTVQGWNGYLRSAIVTPDGRRLVAGHGPGEVKVWDTADGREVLRFQGHSAAIPALAVTADGTRLVTGSEDGTAKVWDLLSGRPLLTLRGHTGPISSVAVTADMRRIVTGSADGTARVWEAASPGQVAAWAGQEKEAERHLAAWRAPRRPRPGLHPRLAGPAPLPLEVGRSRSEALDHEQVPGEARLRPSGRAGGDGRRRSGLGGTPYGGIRAGLQPRGRALQHRLRRLRGLLRGQRPGARRPAPAGGQRRRGQDLPQQRGGLQIHPTAWPGRAGPDRSGHLVRGPTWWSSRW